MLHSSPSSSVTKRDAGASRGQWITSREVEYQRTQLRTTRVHSQRRLRLSRVALPLVAATLLLMLVVWPMLSPNSGGFRIVPQLQIGTPATAAVPDQLLTVTEPRLMGLDGRDQPFTITADKAEQDSLNDGRIRMVNPKADVTLHNKQWLAMSSPEAMVDRTNQRAFFNGGVTVFHDQGYELRADAVWVDTTTGATFSEAPVLIQGPVGRLEGQGFMIHQNGTSIQIAGPAAMVIDPNLLQQPQVSDEAAE